MLYLLLPTYNEEKSIGKLLKRIKKEIINLDYQVVIVDDGSTDRTKEIVSSLRNHLPLLIFDHQRNKGLGETIKTGLKEILKISKVDDILIIMDADNTHSPALTNQIVKIIKEGNDLVIASRYTEGGREVGLIWYRCWLSKGANLLLKLFFPILQVTDYTSGYRGYRISILKKASEVYGKEIIQEKGFACMAELLLKLAKFNPKIKETGLILRYDLKKGKSKIKIIKTIRQYFNLIKREKIN